jgi:hypothetical protein
MSPIKTRSLYHCTLARLRERAGLRVDIGLKQLGYSYER